MNEFKTKKLAEFDNNFVDWNRCYQINENKNVNDIKQFISDLIDEIVGAIPAAKDETYIVNCIQCKDENAKSWNDCRETLINKLKNK